MIRVAPYLGAVFVGALLQGLSLTRISGQPVLPAPANGSVCATTNTKLIDAKEEYRKLCLDCHGANGQGSEDAYEIRHPSRKYSTWVLRNGRSSIDFGDSEMPAFDEKELSSAKANAIWDWLASIPQPQTGLAIYRDYCGNCHGPKGRGGFTGKKVIGKEYGDIKEKCRKGKGGTSYGNRTKYMPSWTSKTLSDDMLKRIAQYLKGLDN